MAVKKNFLPAFDPPRVVRAADRWYISFYAPDDLNGQRRHHFRPTFNLNRIHDLRQREARAEELCSKLLIWLSAGLPISKFDEQRVRQEHRIIDLNEGLQRTKLGEAFQLVIDLKSQLRDESSKTYSSTGKLFLQFMQKQGWGDMLVGDMQVLHARAYLDHCVLVRKLSNNTWNNQLIQLKTLCNDLIERGYLRENPFGNISRKKKMPKVRRNFTPEEARVVLARIQAESELLFLAVLLEYCCFFRPKEIRSMKFQDFDLEAGIITLSADRTKDWEKRVATIPSQFLPYFRPAFFSGHPRNSYIFGAGFEAGQSKPCGKNTISAEHRRVLDELAGEGLLANREGLQLYSWKDTGITDALESLPVLAVQDQAGHHSPTMTMKYRHKKEVNDAMRGFSSDVIEKKVP